MKLLGLETSSARGSVALSTGARVIERHIQTPREQTELVLQLTAELLAEAGIELRELDGIAFGKGPGSFTGLRLAAAVAQGFALSCGVPLLPVSSLLALAQGAWRAERVGNSLICIDARMGEVYWGEFAVVDGLAVNQRDDQLSLPNALSVPAVKPWTAIGNGFSVYAQQLEPLLAGADRVLPELLPSAQDLFPQAAQNLVVGRVTPVAEALPVYLRGQAAWRR
ncbi:MAG TPA: tRNA (adenosine(37)-N6)-threonylcarbamoyltransferase complex dimerization subunit type 1 TsaB [Gammaproteobacteria bacterium]|nr:tRNA (adenosine(37)-N6)-threonylcarbamoyltransferase complex dimerization subunit type 1 TsaB [Gammaproteobacteria bacterium]